jgi:hypothetical protein
MHLKHVLEYLYKQVELNKERNLNAHMLHRGEIINNAQNEAKQFTRDRREDCQVVSQKMMDAIYDLKSVAYRYDDDKMDDD